MDRPKVFGNFINGAWAEGAGELASAAKPTSPPAPERLTTTIFAPPPRFFSI